MVWALNRKMQSVSHSKKTVSIQDKVCKQKLFYIKTKNETKINLVKILEGGVAWLDPRCFNFFFLKLKKKNF